jgi:hypothetical protein
VLEPNDRAPRDQDGYANGSSRRFAELTAQLLNWLFSPDIRLKRVQLYGKPKAPTIGKNT